MFSMINHSAEMLPCTHPRSHDWQERRLLILFPAIVWSLLVSSILFWTSSGCALPEVVWKMKCQVSIQGSIPLCGRSATTFKTFPRCGLSLKYKKNTINLRPAAQTPARSKGAACRADWNSSFNHASQADFWSDPAPSPILMASQT